MVFSHIPPTQGALLQHVKRAAFQAGFVRAQSMVEWQSLPSPSDWAWQCVDNVWHPVWMTLLTAAHLCPAVIKQDAPRSDASGSVQTCPVQLCVIVRENVTEKTTLNGFLGDSETNYTASYTLMFNIRFDVLDRDKQKQN